MTNLVLTQILQPLQAKADALFWKASGYDITSAQTLGYISVPDDAAVITTAAGQLVQNTRGFSECPSKTKDRIFFMKCLCGVPMFAYNGVSDYGMEYGNNKTIGKHLYELTDRDGRDWRNLSDLQPYSENQNTTPEIEERAKMYDEAVKRGIVRQSPNSDSEYQIVEWPAIDDLVENAEKAISENNMESMKAAADAINAYKSNKQPEQIISITNDGAPGHEPKVMKDHVVDSKKMSDVIRSEIAKEDKLEEVLKSLDAARTSIGSGMMSKENFKNALYTGVISVNIPRITCSEERRGMRVNEIVLSEPAMEPYGKLVPFYQAFITYSNMTEEDRKRIDEMTLNRMNGTEWQAVMQDSCESLEQTFSDRYLGVMQQKAEMIPEHSKEIVELLLDFVDGIEEFKTSMGLL